MNAKKPLLPTVPQDLRGKKYLRAVYYRVLLIPAFPSVDHSKSLENGLLKDVKCSIILMEFFSKILKEFFTFHIPPILLLLLSDIFLFRTHSFSRAIFSDHLHQEPCAMKIVRFSACVERSHFEIQ